MKSLILSDAHGDVESLEQAKNRADELFPGEITNLWFLGDAAGYCSTREAVDCYKWLKKKQAIAILGNWEWWIKTPELDQQDPARSRRLEDIKRFREQLPKDTLADIQGWQESLVCEDKKVSLYHGIPLLNKRDGALHSSECYLETASQNDQLFRNELIKTPLLFVGHAHTPKHVRYDPRLMGFYALDQVVFDDDRVEIPNERILRKKNCRSFVIGAVGRTAAQREGDFLPASAAVLDLETFSVTYFRVW